ncbi:Fe-S cluster assembly iron-binding protein IscA [Caloramator quimbayensis]|uniref:Fe-S cluster assembly iron-binding protein IscA n=1 Tax=Caloramator quimbayensis TaxID=1147123 RepID=A0A1T4WWX5_9CLOT|nr:hypothetical protein [Caloramator quimbayensis]SKA81141.1 Fe-S cluster assembly iron-binding protein IscA [Caloramator quimbayensis]
MNIKIEKELLKELGEALKNEGKEAARFILVDFGCSGPIFDIEFDNVKDNDIVVELEGVKFVAEDKFKPALGQIEVIKSKDKFTVKKKSCGCGC